MSPLSQSVAQLAQRYPGRATQWRLKTRTLDCSGGPVLMGIVNVTPDSFSDGGRFAGQDDAVAHAMRLEDEGAAVLDIGGESTRPYSDPVSLDEELSRVMPVVEALAARTTVPLSIDTSKATVARQAIGAGAEIINDVTGLAGDPEMVDVALETGAGICAMHMQGTPADMQDEPQYEDVVRDIHEYLRSRRDSLLRRGLDASRICLDPGIGFGKTHEHNLDLMSHADCYHDLGCPLLIGHSRKGFLTKVLGDKEAGRTSATVGAAMSLAAQGIQVIRVHDVRPVREALLAFQACGGLLGRPTPP